MRCGTLVGLTAAACLLAGSAWAQTNVITNGSFESGLTGWTVVAPLASAIGTCQYNGVTAPGTDAVTGLHGYPATDGTRTALGGIVVTSGAADSSCVLYQDVAIPVGATTATLAVDIGHRNSYPTIGVAVAIYSAATVPVYGDAALAGDRIVHTSSGSATPETHTSAAFDISALAGTTVRVAIIDAALPVGAGLICLDNVRLLVNVTPPAPVPALPTWAFAVLALVLAAGAPFLSRRG